MSTEDTLKRPDGYYNPADENGHWRSMAGDLLWCGNEIGWHQATPDCMWGRYNPGARPIEGYKAAHTPKRILPDDPEERKKYPIVTGVLDYFPRTIAALARCSYEGNQQHNPGKPLHWDRNKSYDDIDALGRHLIDRHCTDGDQIEAVKVAWRALATCEKLLERES